MTHKEKAKYIKDFILGKKKELGIHILAETRVMSDAPDWEELPTNCRVIADIMLEDILIAFSFSNNPIMAFAKEGLVYIISAKDLAENKLNKFRLNMNVMSFDTALLAREELCDYLIQHINLVLDDNTEKKEPTLNKDNKLTK